MSVNSSEIYEECDLLESTISLTSRLYSLEPIGIGTAYIESLTGYSARIAKAHCLSMSALFEREIAPLMDKAYLLRGGARPELRGSTLSNSFRFRLRAINGMGVIAKDWVQSLEALTLRSNFELLTMLPWAGVISQKYLLHTNRAWCPACYEEWRVNGQEIYEPLIWALKVVTACVRHKRRLSFRCHHCNKQLFSLARRSHPGCCSNCRKWLGSKNQANSVEESVSDNEIVWQHWVLENLGGLFAAAPNLQILPQKKRLRKVIDLCIEQLAEGNLTRFASLLKKQKTTVWGWRSGHTKIPMADLLRICYCIGLSSIEFLTNENLELKCENIRLLPLNQFPNTERAIRHKAFPDRNKTQDTLKGVLKEVPPPSVQEVAKRYTYDKRQLYKHFPDLCHSIAARYLKYVKAPR